MLSLCLLTLIGLLSYKHRLCAVSSLQEEMNGWLEAVAATVAENAEIARWGQTLPTTSSTDEGNPKRETGERRASGRRK